MRDAEPTGPRVPRPVADAPVAPFAHGTGLAKAWLLELVAQRPLDEAAGIPVDRLAREAPALCAAVCAALRDDEALGRLAPGGPDAGLAAAIPELVGAAGPAEAVMAVEALRLATWRALREELRAPDAALVGDLADRLAHVCGVVAAGAVAVADPSAVPAPGARAREDAITVSDERPAAPSWTAALRRRLAHHVEGRRPSALLLVELDDRDRLLGAHDASELAGAIRELEQAVAGVLRPQDALVREDAGRYWVDLDGADAATARELADAIAVAVGEGVPLRGAPLRVSVGVATRPPEGADLEALQDRAEEGVFLARAAGVPVGD